MTVQIIGNEVYKERYYLNELMKGLQSRHCRKHVVFYLKRMNVLDKECKG